MNNHSKVLKQTQKYFSWGDIRGQNKNGTGSYLFTEANYQAGVCGSGYNLNGDFIPGDIRYDAATANMGSTWKMPTEDQGDKLINGTNRIWTTINGVNGYKFTSKTDSSKYIFLPAGGWHCNTIFDAAELAGYYWSATWYSSSGAYDMGFGQRIIDMRVANRYYGTPVRAVQ